MALFRRKPKPKKFAGPQSGGRKFGGVQYILGSVEDSRRDANKTAKYLRAQGIPARITTTKMADGSTGYLVWGKH